MTSLSAGGFWSILKSKDILLIAPIAIICYAPVAGLRGIWLGPYFEEKFEASVDEIGTIGLIMSLGMIFGTFFYGPLDRIFKTRKWIVLTGNFICLLSVAGLSFLSELSYTACYHLFRCHWVFWNVISSGGSAWQKFCAY